MELTEGNKLYDVLISKADKLGLSMRRALQLADAMRIKAEELMTAKQLLSAYKTNISYSEMESKMLQHGFLDFGTAQSPEGEEVDFFVLKEKGLVFGENVSVMGDDWQVTEPRFYLSRSLVLLELLEVLD